jgi:hypothetical protein
MDFRGLLSRGAVLAGIALAGPGAAGAAAAVTVEPVKAVEGEEMVFRVVSDALLGEVVSVQTRDGTAKAGEDYTAQNRPVVAVPGGATGAIVTVPTTGDDVAEDDETLELVVKPPVGGSEVVAAGTILNDDDPPIAAGAAPAREGTPIKFAVGLVMPTTKTVTVTIETADDVARAGEDYTATKRTLEFAPGERAKVVEIPTLQDAVFERDETLLVKLGGVANATLPVTQVKLVIAEDDPPPTLTMDGAPPVAEGDSGTTQTGARLTLSAPSAVPAVATVATAPSSATAGEDFEPLVAEVVFAPGETVKPVFVNIKGDTDIEKDERFFLLAVPKQDVQIAGDILSVVLTIRNDDRDTQAPAIAVGAPKLSRSGVLSAAVACPAGETRCSGRLTFFKDADAKAKDKRVRREARLGSVAVKVDGGKRQTVRLRLSAAQRALLRSAGRPRISAYAVVRDAAGNTGQARRRSTVAAK